MMIRTAVFLMTAAAAALQWYGAERLVAAGELDRAEAEYRAILADEPARPEAHYNLGTVLLIQGRYEEARPHLERAANEEGLRARAAYNLGNADLEPAHADDTLSEREERLRRAIDAYRMALLADPNDEDARWNLELAWRLLESDDPPDPDESDESGGGGGGRGGAAGEGAPREGERQPAPAPAAGGAVGGMSAQEAEELLGNARDQELLVQQEMLRRPQAPGPIRP